MDIRHQMRKVCVVFLTNLYVRVREVGHRNRFCFWDVHFLCEHLCETINKERLSGSLSMDILQYFRDGVNNSVYIRLLFLFHS